METNNQSNPKKDQTQKVNEGFSGQNLPKDYNPAATKLEQELGAHRHAGKEAAQKRTKTDEK